MKILQTRSLQLRLITRLAALFLVGTVLAAGMFLYLSSRTADSLSRRDLLRQAEELAESIDKDYTVRSLSQLTAHGILDEGTIFAIRDAAGTIIAASDDQVMEVVSDWPLATRRPRMFQRQSFGVSAQDYYGFDLRERSPAGLVSVMIAEPFDAEDELLNAMMKEIAFEAAWIIPLFIITTLLVGIFAIRSGLRPLMETADQATTINPGAISVRLNSENLPSEVSPFIDAINRALDRLEEGFDVQRQFTANAAHELRTPLAIITCALDEIDDDSNLAALRQDVARMNRLVEQLLLVARLDSIIIDVSANIDLRNCAREIAEYMAPLALERKRTIALSSTNEPVMIKGNSYAIVDALRNLVENALAHTPPHTEVLIAVSNEGSISISDHGSGIAQENRGHVFDRFWRGQGSVTSGAGLGLAIVKEIMNIHGGSIEISDNPGDGTRFTLRFK